MTSSIQLILKSCVVCVWVCKQNRTLNTRKFTSSNEKSCTCFIFQFYHTAGAVYWKLLFNSKGNNETFLLISLMIAYLEILFFCFQYTVLCTRHTRPMTNVVYWQQKRKTIQQTHYSLLIKIQWTIYFKTKIKREHKINDGEMKKNKRMLLCLLLSVPKPQTPNPIPPPF